MIVFSIPHYLFSMFVCSLEQAAEPDDPQDAVVARQYKEFPEVYKQTASHWSQVYAGGKGRGFIGAQTILERGGLMCRVCVLHVGSVVLKLTITY